MPRNWDTELDRDQQNDRSDRSGRRRPPDDWQGRDRDDQRMQDRARGMGWGDQRGTGMDDDQGERSRRWGGDDLDQGRFQTSGGPHMQWGWQDERGMSGGFGGRGGSFAGGDMGPRGEGGRGDQGSRGSQGGGDWHGKHGYTPGEHTGRGPKGYQRADDRIKEDVNDCLTHDGHVDATNIEVQVQNGEVTLTGTVSERAQKRAAEDAIEQVRGVHDVHNQLRVQRATGANDRDTTDASGSANAASPRGNHPQHATAGTGEQDHDGRQTQKNAR